MKFRDELDSDGKVREISDLRAAGIWKDEWVCA